MHIIAASYSNIGPFEDQIISIYLKSGKYLIKAPIGSGKSFLFFDGLVFALYGYSKRDMLNVHSSQGRTKVLFTNDEGEYYLIERPLTGKKGVKLWKFGGPSDQFVFSSHYEVISWGKDILADIDLTRWEEIEFHRATEIQQHIDLLLPPRSVFLQRHILMQDSDNIFDLQPKARIDILKAMFGLDMIDSLRDKIGELKQTYRTQYKTLTESTHLGEQYKSWIEKFKPLVERIQSLLGQHKLEDSSFDTLQPLFDLTHDPLSDNVDTLHYDLTQWDISPLIAFVSNTATQKTALQQEYQHITDDLSKNHRLYQTKQQLINTTQHELSTINDNGLDSNTLQDTLDQLLQKKETIQTTLQEFQEIDGLSQLLVHKQSEIDLQKSKQETFQAKLSSKDQQREHLTTQLRVLENNQREHFLQQHSHEKQRITDAIQSIGEKQALLDSQKKSLQERINHLEQQLQTKQVYKCELINDQPCPFIGQIISLSENKHGEQLSINQQQFTQIEAQLLTLQSSYLDYQKQLTEANNRVGSLHQDQFEYTGDEYYKLKDALSLISTGDLTEGEKLEQATLNQSLSHLQATFDEIQINYNQKKASYGTNWKEIYHSTKQELVDIDSHIADIRHQLLKVQQHIGALATLQTTLSLTKQELLSLQTTVDQLTQRQHTINELLSTPLYQSLDGLLPLLQSCDKGIAKAQDLYHEKKRVEKESLSLKKELDTSTLLHTIFGKELTLYVLGSYLPLLNEHINAFLAKVVTFQLRITISADGDELELMIDDELGTREVKSLSGGQKTMLRLCWILATSVVFRNTFLLLDETINNIDQTTTSQVAELLTDFVTQYNLTLYAVTHSTQVQNMHIRDQTILLQ